MAELLLEIFSEEIPALIQQNSVTSFASMLVKEIKQRCSSLTIKERDIHSYATPRRMAVFVKNIDLDNILNPPKTTVLEIKGPRVDADYQAISGFMKKYGIVDMSTLSRKNGYFFFLKIKHYNIQNVFKEAIEYTLNHFIWPKSMRWCKSQIRWIRPIRSMLCLLDDKVIPVQFGHIRANNRTYGHRFIAPQQIAIQNTCEYITKLKDAYVILNQKERKRIILDEIDKQLSTLGLKLLKDEKLIDELTGLVEYPVVLLGKIEKRFMNLPKEVLITALRVHQKFLVTTYDNHQIGNYFIIVSNIKTEHNDNVIKGNTRVLNARLSDAEFFIKIDRKTSLEKKLNNLRNLSFHHAIGNMYDKTMRMINLALQIAQDNGGLDHQVIQRSAMLSKCDLTTNMVGEFPELQGIMGAYYALCDGENEEVSISIGQHYRPQGQSDALPTTKLGAIISITDKLDTLDMMFKHNIKPTGSKDPYALRRAALGIIRVMLKYGINLFPKKYGIVEDAIEFIKERLNNLNCDDINQDREIAILDTIKSWN